jgi:hypothetical protein
MNQPMNPLEQLLKEALKNFSHGKITEAEMQQIIEQSERELGAQAVEKIICGDPSEGSEINMAEEWDKYLRIEQHGKEEWAKISKNYNFENERMIGKYLVAYLKMEYFVNTLIREEFQERGYKIVEQRLRLAFPVKLDLLRIENRAYLDYLELAEELNQVRNKFAHRLDFDIVKFKGRAISRFLNPALEITGEEKLQHLIELIQLCCYYFQLETEPTRKKTDEIFNN